MAAGACTNARKLVAAIMAPRPKQECGRLALRLRASRHHQAAVMPAASIAVAGGEFAGLQRANSTNERSVGVKEAARDLSHLQRVEVGQAWRAPPWARSIAPLVSLRVEYGVRR
jgi:hypothetical protein